MKKVFTYALLFLVGAAFGAVQANAETAASQRMTNKITQKVQNSKKVVKMKAIPEKAFAPAYLLWWNDNELQRNVELHYTQEGQTSNRLKCYVILCNYKEEKGVGVVTAALDKRCINKMSDWNSSDFFSLEVKLGKFGGYKHTNPYSYPEDPYYFQTTVQNNKKIRSPELKEKLKSFFEKNGSISMDRAGNGLKMMKDPEMSYQFEAYN